MPTKSECNAVDLLAAIFGGDAQMMRYKRGLPSKYQPCLNCGNATTNESRICSPECRKAYTTIMVECSQCHKLFPIVKSQLIGRTKRSKNDGVFCNNVCHGKWAGEHYGFIAHPENAIHGQVRKRGYDYDMVWQKHFETGYGALRLSRLLNIPESTISYILAKKEKSYKERGK